MANLGRKRQKVFAENAINNGQFGSLQATTKVTTTDTDVIQALAAFLAGWNDAVISGEELPALEELQGLHFLTTRQIAYLLNKGIPEWEAATEYFIGDIQRDVTGTNLYRSITDNNIGNVVTDLANWLLLGDLADLATEATTAVRGKSLLPSQITISNNTGEPDHDIDFTAGNFQFDDGSGQATASALTKQIDAVWVVGNDLGGLDTGTVAADTVYYMFAIHDPTIGAEVSDFLFSLSPTAPTLPSGYTKQKKIAALHTDGSANIRQGFWFFDQDGSYRFELETFVVAFQGATTTGPVPKPVICPPNMLALLMANQTSSANCSTLITDLNATDSTPLHASFATLSSSSQYNGMAYPDVRTNSSSEVRVRSTSATGTLSIRSIGWIDNNL